MVYDLFLELLGKYELARSAQIWKEEQDIVKHHDKLTDEILNYTIKMRELLGLSI